MDEKLFSHRPMSFGYPSLTVYRILLRRRRRFEKNALPFVPARYNRTFDVISEVNCVLLKRKRRFENIALYPNFDVISEVNCVLPRGKFSIKRLLLVNWRRKISRCIAGVLFCMSCVGNFCCSDEVFLIKIISFSEKSMWVRIPRSPSFLARAFVVVF